MPTSDLWSATVDISDVVRTPDLTPPPPPDNTDPAFPNGANGPLYRFQAMDYIIADPLGDFTLFLEIKVECSDHPSLGPMGGPPEWLVEETHRWRNHDNTSTAVFATYFSANGSNGTAFLGGATLKIDKDEANAKYVITGLMGNSELLFVDAPGPGPGPGVEFMGLLLEVEEGPYAYDRDLSIGQPAKIVKTHVEVGFSQFWTYKNGTPRRGATLSNTDRGHWLPSPGLPSYDASYTPWIVPVLGSYSVVITNPDTVSRIVAGITSGSNPTTIMGVNEYRQWDRTRFLPIPGTLIDMVHAKEHAAHFLAYIIMGSDDTIKWARSHDKVRTVATGDVVVGGTNASPNIAWAFGKLYVIWEDAGSIKLSASSDFANSWSTPLTLLTGTNPRLLTDPTSGFSWLFYIDGSDLKLIRSGNFFVQNVDAAPVIVASIDQQTVAAQLALDGSLIVTYQAGGDILSLRSSDLGRSWS